MSMSDRDVLEAMDRAVMDPPPMSLSPDAVVELGRSKVRRRRAVGAGMSIAAAAVAVTAWVGLSSGFDVVGDQIDPATTDPGETLLVAEPNELSLLEVGDQLELSDSTGVVALVPKDMGGEQTILDGPDGLTYVVVTDWPQSAATVALVEDPRTGWTVPLAPTIPPQKVDGQYVAAALPPGPDGERLKVVSLAAMNGSLAQCEMHVPGEAGPATSIGSPNQIAYVQVLADGHHWTACVLGDIFAGDTDRPVAQWRGNAMMPVEAWDSGFPDGLFTVLHEEEANTLDPVWSTGQPAVDLGAPTRMSLGDGLVALDWSIPLEALGGNGLKTLEGFDVDADGTVDVSVLPLGANRTLHGGRAFVGAVERDGSVESASAEESADVGAGRRASDPRLATWLAEIGGPWDIVVDTHEEFVDNGGQVDLYLRGAGTLPFDQLAVLAQTPEGIELSVPITVGSDSLGRVAVTTNSNSLPGGSLLPAVVLRAQLGPYLLGGEPPLTLRSDPEFRVGVSTRDDLWVARDDGKLVAGRLSDPDLPFEVDADGIPTTLVNQQ